jgi:hypothetical protein
VFKNPEEYFYLHALSQWQRTAPLDGHQGVMGNGKIQRNTQAVRMAYLLTIIDDGDCKTFRKLATHTRRNDGTSYVSNDNSWMREPHLLRKGWYLGGV